MQLHVKCSSCSLCTADAVDSTVIDGNLICDWQSEWQSEHASGTTQAQDIVTIYLKQDISGGNVSATGSLSGSPSMPVARHRHKTS